MDSSRAPLVLLLYGTEGCVNKKDICSSLGSWGIKKYDWNGDMDGSVKSESFSLFVYSTDENMN